jgi:hypothetical protein
LYNKLFCVLRFQQQASPSNLIPPFRQAVAGATICALGCNGPEMFTNLISLYTGSDAGRWGWLGFLGFPQFWKKHFPSEARTAESFWKKLNFKTSQLSS